MIAAACLAAVGCGGSSNTLDVHPVAGVVTFNGKPIEGANVVFFGQDQQVQAKGVPMPQGTTDSAGRYQLTTYHQGDGAPAGNYGVAVVWNQIIQPGESPEQRVEKDRLGGRYADYEKSGLTAVVEPKSNELPPFNLK